jgi:hypothetical protein
MLSLGELLIKYGAKRVLLMIWQDIEVIVIEKCTTLDQQYLDDWLKQFADILEKPQLLLQYQQIWPRVKTSRILK